VAELSSFQTRCEAALTAALSRAGARLVERQITGVGESYIRAKIGGTSLEVYIYTDEAQVQGESVDERFEAPDFKTGDLLSEAFIRKALELAKNAVA